MKEGVLFGVSDSGIPDRTALAGRKGEISDFSVCFKDGSNLGFIVVAGKTRHKHFASLLHNMVPKLKLNLVDSLVDSARVKLSQDLLGFIL